VAIRQEDCHARQKRTPLYPTQLPVIRLPKFPLWGDSVGISDNFIYLCVLKMTYILMKVKIVNKSRHPLPQYETSSAAGMDVRASLTEPVVLHPLERKLIPTGLYIALPQGYEAQLRPRSGLAIRHGITLLNTPGTIDADYRGEIGIIMVNLSVEPFVINDGERICQMVIASHARVEWQAEETLDETERGTGGFGHTGK
jgi:dUTP pyrophosphatase